MVTEPLHPRPAAGAYATRAAVVRVARQLGRLEALAARHRARKRIVRALRGGAGGGSALLALAKAKLVGSLAGKLAIATLVGLGLAWPLLALGILWIAVVILSILSCDPAGLESCDCIRPNARRARLRRLIAERRAWLAAPSGAAPRIRDARSPRRAWRSAKPKRRSDARRP